MDTKAAVVQETREETRREAEPKASRYVPPSMRHQQSQPPGSLAPAKLRSLRTGKAPEIENQQEFPSLGAETVVVEPKPAPIVNSWRESTVRSAVSTANKFDALRDGDM